jgi:hypothetical protein
MRTKTLEQKTAHDFAGLQIDQLQKLRNGNMTYEQAYWWNNISYEQREQLMGKQPQKEAILKLISGAEELKLDAVDGTRTIANSKGVFSYIDPDFKGYGVNEKSVDTKETQIEVYELTKDANFAKIYGSTGREMDTMCVTQHQILNFIAKHRNWLRTEGYGTFFLFKMNGEFFVADVDFDVDGSLRVFVFRFGYDYVWIGSYRRRFVLPQLAS